jgi:hypothetical protein
MENAIIAGGTGGAAAIGLDGTQTCLENLSQKIIPVLL